MNTKVCTKCEQYVPLNGFSKRSSTKDGLQSRCKECCNEYATQYRLDNLENIAAYRGKHYIANKENISAYNNQYYLDNKEQISATSKQYRLTNKENINVRQKQRRLANPDKEKERIQSEKWRLDNPEKRKASQKKYRAANLEKTKAYSVKYQLANPEKIRASTSARRAKKLANGVYQISNKELERLYSSPCFYCGSTESIQMDHVIPIKKGGTHGIGNLVPACQKCNYSKGSKLLIEWKVS